MGKKTSQHEEEPPEIQRTTYMTRRKRAASVPERLQYPYQTDEYPKVRRASRLRESSSIPSIARTRYRARQHAPEDELETDIFYTPSLNETSHKIVINQRRHTRVYEPPLTRRRYKYSRRHILLRAIKRHTTLVYISVLLALVLILIPLSQLALRQGAHLIPINPATQTTPSKPSSADPHQLVITPSTTDHPAPPVYASAAYLLDADSGATFYAHNPFEHLPILSTTKLMTALVAAEEGADRLDKPIPINAAIARDLNTLSPDSSLMGIKPGETYTLRELLYGALLMSGNDACIAIADGLDGNLAKFVSKMNQRAHDLGMLDTHYMNPHGLLDTGHYSSAHDLAILGKYSLSNPIVHAISATKEYTIPKTKQHPERSMFNGNQFLWWYPGVDGGKPGWDGNKNFNQVISVVRNHHHLIGVVLNTVDWWTDMRNLMNWGYDNFAWISPRDLDAKQTIPYDADWNYFAKDHKENTIPIAKHGRYYIYTGYSVFDPILAYYDKNGGLKKIGYPRGMPITTSNTTLTQKFDKGVIRCDTSTHACEIVPV